MLIVVRRQNGELEVLDSDETPFVYVLTMKEQELAFKQAADSEKEGRTPVNACYNTRLQPYMRGVGLAAVHKAMVDRLTAHPNARFYIGERRALKSAEAGTVEMPAPKIVKPN